ncbi:hypothetical protein PAXRUDRAFT_160449, partial [Paxillus rubicundulus Ve08.2h10]
CYKVFKAYHSSVWSEILEVFEMAEMTKNVNQTFSQRAQMFNKLQRRFQVDAGAIKHGFQAAVIMCGNAVNEDASLGFAHTTPGATEYFETRCRTDENGMIGNLKSHVL